MQRRGCGKGILSLEDYPIVDYILGLEKEDNSSNPARNTYYKTFSSPMQRILTSYCQSGGHLLVSGAYVGSDMDSSQGNKEFIQNILKYRHGNSLKQTGTKSLSGDWGIPSPFPACRMSKAIRSLPLIASCPCLPLSSHDLCHRQHTRRRSLSRQ